MVNYQTASAEIFYPTIHFRLNEPPVYCINFPTQSGTEELKSKWVSEAKNAISEWELKLKQAELENQNLWELNYKVVHEDDSKKDCTINLYFKDKTESGNKRALGSFSAPPPTIEIYTLKLELCYLNSYCFKDNHRNLESIHTTILHEIGHSFGLDHYTSDDVSQNFRWVSILEPPSIMIPSQHGDPSLQKITNRDIQKIREIYSNGFYTFSQQTPPKPRDLIFKNPEPIIQPEPIEEPISKVEPTPKKQAIPKTNSLPRTCKGTKRQTFTAAQERTFISENNSCFTF